MPDLSALRQVWPQRGSLEEKLAAVNAMVASGPVVDIAVTAIKGRLPMEHLECFALTAKTADIRERLHMPAVSKSVMASVYLLRLLEYERLFSKSRLDVLRGLLNDLSEDEASGVTREMADDIMAQSVSSVPWWSAHGFSQPGVGIYDAIAAQLA
jgi:hypothetical protein